MLVSLVSANPQSCDKQADMLLASYQTKQLDQHGRTLTNKLNLYRLQNEVGHFYPNQNYGDWWSKTPNEQLLLTRYFPEYHRSIEYQPTEIGVKKKRSNAVWQKKWQLISTKLLSKMKVSGVEGEGCHQIELLTYKEKGKKYKARWYTKLQLLERFEIYKGSQLQTSWRLKDLNTDTEFVRRYAKNISAYQSTDYADIGDMESDPFLSKMINQGFSQQDVNRHEEHGHSH